MKFLFVQLAALSAAFILPDEQVSYLQNVEKKVAGAVDSTLKHIPSKPETIRFSKDTLERISEDVEEAYEDTWDSLHDEYVDLATHSEELFDKTMSSVEEAGWALEQGFDSAYSDLREWTSSAIDKIDELDVHDLVHSSRHGHHSKPNLTAYQLISESKYTQKFAKLVSEFDDLVKVLNGTAANYTLFAPTDRAFDHLPEHHKLSKEQIEKILLYHVSADYYPVKRILFARTIPTLLKSKNLGKSKPVQRLSTQIGWRGVTINYLTRVVGVNKLATNGVVHLVDSFIPPPILAAEIIDLAPSVFSTLQVGLVKTGLFDKLNSTNHAGGTLFAPSNSAFERLGVRTNAFLFSKAGLKYLKAILAYHICPNNTLYSDAYYKSSSEADSVPKGTYHVELPTALDGRSLSIDIARLGRLIEIKINAYDRVSSSDIVADDGVIHIPQSVLIPPKKLANGEWEEWNTNSGEITVEELVEGLEPYVTDIKSHEEEL